MLNRPWLAWIELPLLACALAACDSSAQQAAALASAPETQAKVQALVSKTLGQMKFVEGGSFWMGDFGVIMPGTGEGKIKDTPPPGPKMPEPEYLPFTEDKDNKPPRWVTLSAYSIQSHKVTYGDFDVYVAANALPKHPPEGDESLHRIWKRARTSDDIPAGVTWTQAKSYCQWLGRVTSLPFDLPTEAQWEFAAANRTNSASHPFPTRSGILEKDKTHPSFKRKEEMIGARGALYRVAQYEPSPLGLYDLVGNGLDWTNDWYDPKGYGEGPVTDPKGPETGTERVLRGGLPSEGFSRRPYVDRYHMPPEGFLAPFDHEPFPYRVESFRCVTNQTRPIAAPESS